jgi:hypothetical protein
LAYTGKANPEELVMAFRKAANELGCNQSEQRFQEALFAIGRHKPLKRLPKRADTANWSQPQIRKAKPA